MIDLVRPDFTKLNSDRYWMPHLDALAGHPVEHGPRQFQLTCSAGSRLAQRGHGNPLVETCLVICSWKVGLACYVPNLLH